MTADGQIKSYFERWERLEAEKKAIGDDLKELFAEAKDLGFDSKALRAAFRLKVKQDLDSPADAEFEAVVDVYLSALNGSARDPRMRVRENIEEFDPITGEFIDDAVNPKLIKQVVDGMQTKAGRAALIAAVDVLLEQEEVEFPTSPEEGAEAKGAATDDAEDRVEGDTDRQRSPEAGTTDGGRQGVREQEASAPVPAPISQSDDDAIAAVKGNARLANVADVEPSSSGQIDPSEDRGEGHSPESVNPPVTGGLGANVGGDHVTAQPAATHQAEALVKSASATKPLRPHCRNPGEHCGGYGSNHCGSCLRAAREEGVAA